MYITVRKMADSTFVVVDIGSPTNKTPVPSRNVDVVNVETNDASFFKYAFIIFILAVILIILAIVIYLVVAR
jgi:hypothetical protein